MLQRLIEREVTGERIRDKALRAQTNDFKAAKMDLKARESDIAGENKGRRGAWREPAPLSVFTRLPFYPWLVVATVCIGAFMGQVDASIAQLVLPELRRGFHEPVSAVAWVSIAYLLVVTAMLPIVSAASGRVNIARPFFIALCGSNAEK